MAADSSNGSYVATDVFPESFFAKVDFGDYGWSPRREYPAFTEIIQQDTPARAVYFIEYGLVKLSRMLLLASQTLAQAEGTFIPTGSMNETRAYHTATLLKDGTVLIAGGYNSGNELTSAEIYNPATGTFTPTVGNMTMPRHDGTYVWRFTATLLNNGKVLIAGGTSSAGIYNLGTGYRELSSAELYDPATGTFTPTASDMIMTRSGHTATLLRNGKVLIVGGSGWDPINGWSRYTAEIYDPATDMFSLSSGRASEMRWLHSATLLDDGRVLIATGIYNGGYSAEIYNPSSDTFGPLASLVCTRGMNTATLLNSGQVLFTGGYCVCLNPSNGVYESEYGSTELYDPATNAFTRINDMNIWRVWHEATLLKTGHVLITGGWNSVAPADLYDPATGTFTLTGTMVEGRTNHTATLLNNGQVLVAGGQSVFSYSNPIGLSSAELYTPPSLSLSGATFLGGTIDERGTGVAVENGTLYISGISGNNNNGIVAQYNLPLSSGASPVWSTIWPNLSGSSNTFASIAATNEGVYLSGENYSLTVDSVGGKEQKGMVVKFPLTGTTGSGHGGCMWDVQTPPAPGAFPYGGIEGLKAVTVAEEAGSTYIYTSGNSQQNFSNGGRLYLSKLGSDGTVFWTQNDSADMVNNAFSSGFAITTLNGDIYTAGRNDDDGSHRPYLRKYDPLGTLFWLRKNTTLTGNYYGIAVREGAIYAVGVTNGASSDFLIDKWDESGNLQWSMQYDRNNAEDILYGVVGNAGIIYAVGSTNGNTAGGADAIILEIDPATGALLNSTLWGGASDDIARAIATDGTNLYIVGETSSYGAGGKDVMVLAYSLGLADTTPDPFSFTSQTGVALSTSITSNAITISGINSPSLISISGGTYSVNGGVYTTAPGTVNNGDAVTIRVISWGTNLSTRTATLTIGGVSGTFSVTTMAANTPPTPSVTITQSGWTVTATDNSTDAEEAQSALGVTVDWGSGSPSTGTGGSTFTKTYTVAGTYIIKHGARDTDGRMTWTSPNKAVTVPVKYQVAGRVMMLNGTTPVSNASVRLKVDASVKKMTTTNSGGNYTFMDVLPDSYTVEAVKSGLTFSSTPAAVVTNANVTVPDIKATR